ncbi:MAG: Holliday junction resolvase RuvX [Pseudomonadales bacterium]
MTESPTLVLAFDFGLRQIGVAVGQALTGTASPLETLRARDGAPDWVAVRTLVDTWRPERLLVGLPLNMDDTESAMSARARAFAERLGRTTNTPVELVDERLSSREAAARSSRGSPRDAASHATAAAVIAETWLSERG